MTRLGITARVGVLGIVFAVLAPLQMLASRRGARIAHRLPVHYHRLFLRLFNIRVEVRGIPPQPGRPTCPVISDSASVRMTLFMGKLRSVRCGWRG